MRQVIVPLPAPEVVVVAPELPPVIVPELDELLQE